jgi:hypothetical protein
MACLRSLIVVFIFISATAWATAKTATGSLSEGLLVDADLTQGTQTIGGRVLIEAGRTEWTTIAESKAKNLSRLKHGLLESPLKLEARATLLEPDVVEVETRITGRSEQNGKLIVRLGERAEMTTSQMESSESATKEAATPTNLGVKVLRVRYSL